MKMLLLGWLLKGSCQTSLLDALVFIGEAMVIFLVYSLGVSAIQTRKK